MDSTCIKFQSFKDPQQSRAPDVVSPSFSRPRRPALIPPNDSLSLNEAEELTGTRTQQPLFPTPYPGCLENATPTSPVYSDETSTQPSRRTSEGQKSRESSPTSYYSHSMETPTMPPALDHDPRRRKAWLKARAQYARDRKLRKSPDSHDMDIACEPNWIAQQAFVDLGPKRKQSTFIKEQELKCLIEDRVGTPHVSELQADDDVIAQLRVEELSVGGEVAALGLSEETESPITNTIAQVPSEAQVTSLQ